MVGPTGHAYLKFVRPVGITAGIHINFYGLDRKKIVVILCYNFTFVL